MPKEEGSDNGKQRDKLQVESPEQVADCYVRRFSTHAAVWTSFSSNSNGSWIWQPICLIMKAWLNQTRPISRPVAALSLD